MQRRGPETTCQPPAIAVWCASATTAARGRASALSAELSLPIVDAVDARVEAGGKLLLTVTAERLELRSFGPGAPGPVFVDFVGGPLGYARRVNRFGLMYKALGIHLGVTEVVDATAGLAHDAFLLALHGFNVIAIERSPVLVALVRDGLSRLAAADSDLAGLMARRLTLQCDDARAYLGKLPPDSRPQAVYVDPMYPHRKKAALVRKEMRVIRTLVGDDEDAESLFDAAVAAATRRVVVKRMAHAPPLSARPHQAHADKTTRYDVYLRQ